MNTLIKVLIAEDESAVRKELMLLTPWEELGCICCGGAQDGKEALEIFNKQKPDLVITDIRMPGIDGLEMISIMAELCAVSGGEHICEFIILSGYSDFEYARRAIRSGVLEYLVKPTDDEELKNAILRAKKRIVQRRQTASAVQAGDNSAAESMLMLFKEYNLGERESVTAKYVQNAIEQIQSRYISGITIEEAAEQMNISAGHLSRIFKQETGYTFVDYLMYFRVKKAAELLQDATVKVYEVADLVGYTDARYFSQIFRRITGLTPKEFKEKKRTF